MSELIKDQKYHYLTYTGNIFNKNNKKRYEFICDCGNFVFCTIYPIIKGIKRSCGCKGRAKKYRETRNTLKEDYPFYVLLQTFLRRSQKRNIEFTLTIEDIKNQFKKQNGKCFYTKTDIDLPINHMHLNGNKIASIDRIDSAIGYIPTNIQLVTKQVNILKQSLSHLEFIKICHIVFQIHHKNILNNEK